VNAPAPFRDREHMLNCLLDEMLKTRRPGETARQFAKRLHPEDLRTLYWQRKIREYADANGYDVDAPR
jgi:hypothetical protein